MPRSLRLQHRIAVPFALIAILATSAAVLLARSFFARTLESRIVAQIENTAAVLSQSDFALNPIILRSARQIAGADVITFGPNRTVLASTVDTERLATLAPIIAGSIAAEDVVDGGSATIRRMVCDVPCLVAFRRVLARPTAVVAVIA